MKQKGFILFYAVIIIGVMAGAAGALMRSTRTESSISLQSAEATKAILASDAGLECVRYWQLASETVENAFSPNAVGANAVINCGVTGSSPGITIPHPYTGQANCLGGTTGPYEHAVFTVGPFANNACARVKVVVSQEMVDGLGICQFAIESRGLNDCTNPTVERSLWENI
jgi:hypothetical protein